MTGKSPRIAVIQFPGVNCEYETRQAFRDLGAEADIWRWNLPDRDLDAFDGYVLPGGFSYQDRIRAGVIAAKEAVMGRISRDARAGKPVLGICNGCQVLVEAGLIPGLEWESVAMALAPNRMDSRRGYYAGWVFLRAPGPSILTRSLEGSVGWDGEPVPLPVAHAEGRFTTRIDRLWNDLEDNGQILFRYAGEGRAPASETDLLPFPANPNGSARNVAGVSNREGNVVALMPHPERAFHLRQVPEDLPGRWGRRRRAATAKPGLAAERGPGAGILASFVAAVREGVT